MGARQRQQAVLALPAREKTCGGSGGVTSSRPIAKKPSLLPCFVCAGFFVWTPFPTDNVRLRFCLQCRRGPSAPLARAGGSKCPLSSFSFSQQKKEKGFLWCQPTAAPGQVPSRKRKWEGGSPACSVDGSQGAGQPTVSPFGPPAESVAIVPPTQAHAPMIDRRQAAREKKIFNVFSNDFFSSLSLAARGRAPHRCPKKENGEERVVETKEKTGHRGLCRARGESPQSAGTGKNLAHDQTARVWPRPPRIAARHKHRPPSPRAHAPTDPPPTSNNVTKIRLYLGKTKKKSKNRPCAFLGKKSRIKAGIKKGAEKASRSFSFSLPFSASLSLPPAAVCGRAVSIPARSVPLLCRHRALSIFRRLCFFPRPFVWSCFLAFSKGFLFAPMRPRSDHTRSGPEKKSGAFFGDLPFFPFFSRLKSPRRMGSTCRFFSFLRA